MKHFKQTLTSIFLFTLLSAFSASAGISNVGNGSGNSEYNLQIAFLTLTDWLKSCQQFDCHLSVDELKLNQSLIAAKTQETGGLIFNDQYPTTLVATLPTVGSPIFINQKLLAELTANSLKRDLNLSESYEMILKALSQHLGATALIAESLAFKIKQTTASLIVSSPLFIQQKEVLKIYTWNTLSGLDQMILSPVGLPFLDVTSTIRQHVDCREDSLSFFKILEPKFIVTKSTETEIRAQINFYVQAQCGSQSYVKEVNLTFDLSPTELKVISVESKY